MQNQTVDLGDIRAATGLERLAKKRKTMTNDCRKRDEHGWALEPTPGPWEYNGCRYITAPSGEVIAQTCDQSGRDCYDAHFDGYLMAAAPELFAALEAERRGTPCSETCVGNGWRSCSRCDERLKNALVKARPRPRWEY